MIIASRLEQMFAPLLESSGELFRSLVTISGGALVASVSVVQLIAENLPDPRFPWMLYTAWISFVATILLSLSGYQSLIRFRTIRITIQATRNEMDRFPSITGAWDHTKRLDTIDKEIAKHIKLAGAIHDVCRKLAIVAFVIAFASFIGFAIANFPARITT